MIPLSHKLSKILSKYLIMRNKEYKISSDSPLFPTYIGNPLKQRDMKRIIDKIRANTSFYFTWHQLRHTFATELVRNNFDIYNISQIL